MASLKNKMLLEEMIKNSDILKVIIFSNPVIKSLNLDIW